MWTVFNDKPPPLRAPDPRTQPVLQLLGPLPPNFTPSRAPVHFTSGVIDVNSERFVCLQFATQNGVQFYTLDADTADMISKGIAEAARIARSGLIVAFK